MCNGVPGCHGFFHKSNMAALAPCARPRALRATWTQRPPWERLHLHYGRLYKAHCNWCRGKKVQAFFVDTLILQNFKSLTFHRSNGSCVHTHTRTHTHTHTHPSKTSQDPDTHTQGRFSKHWEKNRETANDTSPRRRENEWAKAIECWGVEVRIRSETDRRLHLLAVSKHKHRHKHTHTATTGGYYIHI